MWVVGWGVWVRCEGGGVLFLRVHVSDDLVCVDVYGACISGWCFRYLTPLPDLPRTFLPRSGSTVSCRSETSRSRLVSWV